ncbi:MAG: S8 family serine peptidase, partial [Anaerolineae bacterium]|nr:S8 family serine peptidase [Anaerolineae bacterium]
PGDFKPTRHLTYVPALVGTITRDGLSRLQAHSLVRAVYPDAPVQLHLGQSVPALGADIVHTSLGLTGRGVHVATIDTGVDLAHPDLSDDILAQKCFTQGECKPGNTFEGDNAQDENGHGTHVAGVITGRGATTPGGFAPDAKIVSVRVVGEQTGAVISDLVAGLDWVRGQAAPLDISIVNVSLGTFSVYSGTCDIEEPALADAVGQLTSSGVAVFASSGNEGANSGLTAPACNTGVIAVGATYDANLGREPDSGTYRTLFGGDWPACADLVTNLQTIACFSNSSPRVDIVAPGARITAAALGGGSATYSGTSAAAPTAAGVAALMKQANPSLTPPQIAALMKTTGVPLTDAKNGRTFPRLHALSAVQAALNMQPVSGRVLLQGRSSTAGIPLRFGFFDTLTQTDGSFSLLAPPGTYTASAGYPGYLASRRQVTVTAEGAAVPTVRLLGGDADRSGKVDIFDLVLIAGHYDEDVPPGDARADINADGHIGIFDLTIVGVNYSLEQYQPWTVPALSKRAAVACSSGSPSSACPSLSIDAPLQVAAGEEFTVSVRVQAAMDVGGVDTVLGYDPAALTPSGSPQVGGWFAPGQVFVARASSSAARVRFAATRLGLAIPAPSDGVVFTTRFRALRDTAPVFHLLRTDLARVD